MTVWGFATAYSALMWIWPEKCWTSDISYQMLIWWICCICISSDHTAPDDPSDDFSLAAGTQRPYTHHNSHVALWQHLQSSMLSLGQNTMSGDVIANSVNTKKSRVWLHIKMLRLSRLLWHDGIKSSKCSEGREIIISNKTLKYFLIMPFAQNYWHTAGYQ